MGVPHFGELLNLCAPDPGRGSSYTFERFAGDLREGRAELPQGSDEWPADKALLLEEMKIGCVHALLTCLDRAHRLAYILGEILELEGPEAARILNISHTAFRKRVSRAREAIIEFTRAQCDLVNPANACRCARRLPRAQAMRRVNATALLFAQQDSARAFPEMLERVRRLDVVRRTSALYRGSPDADPGPDLLARIRAALDRPNGRSAIHICEAISDPIAASNPTVDRGRRLTS